MAIFTIPFVETSTYLWAVSPLQLFIKRIRGVYSGSTSALYLQLHTGVQQSPTDTNIVAPANGTVPIEEFQIAGTSNFNWDLSYDPATDAIPPMLLILSTTAGTLTAATGESLIDVFVDAEVSGDAFLWTGFHGSSAAPPTNQQIPAGYSLYANNALSAKQTIWADGSGPHELLEIVAYQNNGTATNPAGQSVAYLKLFTQNPLTGVQPFIEIPVVNGQTTPFMRFVYSDNVGIGPIPQTEDSSGTLHNGLYVTMETLGGVYVAANVISYKLQVKYK
jgi:hypothetical protein